MGAIPAVPFVQQYNNLLNLNATFLAKIQNTAKTCGYTDYLAKYLTYPPPGKLPTPAMPTNFFQRMECMGLWSTIREAAALSNPCFNYYHVATTCPLLWDTLGFPGSFEYLPEGATVYFDRKDVKKAINAPVDRNWEECTDILLELTDSSQPSSYSVLPRVIERSERTVSGHGALDYILMVQGSLLSIQNMTWNGKQGFQTKPTEEFFVPYHIEETKSLMSGSGVQGITHTERGLTWVEVFGAGHMVPQYTPSAAYRQLEFLLGRVKSLSERSAFTTQKGIPQPKG